MGERETGMSRGEIAGWLEEMAGQLRTGALMVDGESVTVPGEPETSVKSKSKDGRRRLKLQLEWAEATPKKGKKSKKSEGCASGGCGDAISNGAAVDGKAEKDGGERKQGSVRDYESHVLVCKGSDCSKKGGKDTKKALKSELRSEGMNSDVRVDSVDCLGLCKQGPNVIVYPEGTWYLGLKEGDVPEVVEEHLKGGEPVERLAAGRRSPKKKATRR